MDDILCNISAFRYHRIPPQVRAVLPDLPQPGDDPNLYDLCSHPLVSDALGKPLHVLSRGRRNPRAGRRLVRHSWKDEVPFGAIEETDFGFEVASPLFTLLTLAPHVTNERLIMCAYEVCGSFSVFKVTPCLKEMLVRAYGQDWSGGRFGWENIRDVSGNSTDLWKRDPLVSLEELSDFADRCRGLRGAKSFARAAKCVTGVAASPLEVQASMLFGLSRLRGGEGLSIANNVKINLSNDAQIISDSTLRYADIQLFSPGKMHDCIVECQGKVIHGSVEAKISDSDRTTALQSMGYDVVLMTYSQLFEPDKFHSVMKLIASNLGMELKEKTERQKEFEKRLRGEIFVDWAGI